MVHVNLVENTRTNSRLSPDTIFFLLRVYYRTLEINVLHTRSRSQHTNPHMSVSVSSQSLTSPSTNSTLIAPICFSHHATLKTSTLADKVKKMKGIKLVLMWIIIPRKKQSVTRCLESGIGGSRIGGVVIEMWAESVTESLLTSFRRETASDDRYLRIS